MVGIDHHADACSPQVFPSRYSRAAIASIFHQDSGVQSGRTADGGTGGRASGAAWTKVLFKHLPEGERCRPRPPQTTTAAAAAAEEASIS